MNAIYFKVAWVGICEAHKVPVCKSPWRSERSQQTIGYKCLVLASNLLSQTSILPSEPKGPVPCSGTVAIRRKLKQSLEAIYTMKQSLLLLIFSCSRQPPALPSIYILQNQPWQQNAVGQAVSVSQKQWEEIAQLQKPAWGSLAYRILKACLQHWQLWAVFPHKVIKKRCVHAWFWAPKQLLLYQD